MPGEKEFIRLIEIRFHLQEFIASFFFLRSITSHYESITCMLGMQLCAFSKHFNIEVGLVKLVLSVALDTNI